MVQIIQENRKPSFSERVNAGIGSGLNQLSQVMEQRQSERLNQQAIEAGKNLLGMDLSGFDPETRKALLVEGLKQQGKNQMFEGKQNYLNQLFGGGQQRGPSMPTERGNEGSLMEVQELPQGFDVSSISDEDIARATSVDPNIGRALSHAKDVALREKREGIKQSFDEKKQARKEELDFHKESQKYDEDLTEKTRRAKSQVETFKDIENAIESGNVKPSSWTNILRNFGDVGRSLSNAIMNKDEATILASIPQLLEGWKQVFGIRLTDADLRVLQDKLPDIGKSPEANKAILKVMKKYGEMATLRHKIGGEIKKKNKGLRPLGYSDMIEERFDEMVRPVRVINPKTGNAIEIPAYKVGDAISAGAKLADE